jgi:hypothetical protein
LAIRRSLRRTGTEISREKISWLGNISTECENCDTSQTARKGRQLGGEDKVKVTDKAKVKVQAKVAWRCIPRPHLFSLPMRGFCGMRGKMSYRPKATRPDNGIVTVRSMTERRVAILLMMETKSVVLYIPTPLVITIIIPFNFKNSFIYMYLLSRL